MSPTSSSPVRSAPSSGTPEANCAHWISALDRTEGELVELLSESCQVFSGRSELAVARMRAWVLLQFAARADLPEPAGRVIQEELCLGLHPILVSAAARVLASQGSLDSKQVDWLRQAQKRFAPADRAVALSTYPLNALQTDSTVLTEIETALSKTTAAPEKAENLIRLMPRLPRLSAADLNALPLEDHNAEILPLGSYFTGVSSFVTFFYTRCNNPLKCSANISRWGEVVHALRTQPGSEAVKTAAITYDADFDTPTRLKAYAQLRGVELGAQDRVFRCSAGLAPLQRALNLSVAQGQATITAHAAEAFILSPTLQVVHHFSREPWTVDEVLSHLK